MERIQNSRELEFAIFCIESIADHLSIDAKQIYDALTKQSDILYDYIVPCYETLHTQSKEYIVEDILQCMTERGISL